MGTSTVLTCTSFETLGSGEVTCSQESWVETYVIPADDAAQLELMLNGGFDHELFLQFFGGTVVLFCIGFAVGLIISNIRKIKSI